MDAEAEPRGIYAERDVPHRWPRLVREAAVDGWPGMPDAAPDTADTTDPLTDPEDELFLLGERCAEAYMQADALHYHAMVLLAEFDRRSGWQDTGFSSTAEWLAWRIGIQPGAARERVRTALALEQLPLTSEAMRNGELSFTKVRALSRVATARHGVHAPGLRPSRFGGQPGAGGTGVEDTGPEERSDGGADPSPEPAVLGLGG